MEYKEKYGFKVGDTVEIVETYLTHKNFKGIIGKRGKIVTISDDRTGYDQFFGVEFEKKCPDILFYNDLEGKLTEEKGLWFSENELLKIEV